MDRIGSGVTLRQLELFVAVSRELHFGRAAARMHVSQPVVSDEIRRLERLLGGRLFVRTTRTVALTEFGGVIVLEAEAVLEAATRLAQRAIDHLSSTTMVVRLACTPSVVDGLLPGLVRRSERLRPAVDLREMPVESGGVEELLRAGRADIGIGHFLERTKGFAVDTLRTDGVYVAVATDGPFAAHDTVDLLDLAGLPLLIWPREQAPRYYDALLAICRDRGLDPLILLGPSRVVGVRSYLIAEQRAFALVPEATARTLSGAVTARALTRPAGLPLDVMWRGSHRSPSGTAVLRLIRNAAADS